MKKFLIWGIGKLANQFIENGYNGELIGFIQSNKSTSSYRQKPVYGCNEIPEDYDYIIVANSYTKEIYNLCLTLNIDISKVIFMCSSKERVGCIEDVALKDLLLEKNYTNYCVEFGLFKDSFFNKDAQEYQKLNRRSNFIIQEQYIWPVIGDKYAYAGTIGNYFWQDLWAAKLVIGSKIKQHLDIGSRLDGFISHLLAANIDVTMIDVREFPSDIEHLHTIVDDATYLHQIPDESIESMSALCSLEHFGLGRYGDPIDPEACFKCFDNIQKKLKKDGRLYISLPIGKERVEFNAHRVFYASTIVECFSLLNLEEFSCVAEDKIEYNVDLHKYDNDSHDGEHRYGMFVFVK